MLSQLMNLPVKYVKIFCDINIRHLCLLSSIHYTLLPGNYEENRSPKTINVIHSYPEEMVIILLSYCILRAESIFSTCSMKSIVHSFCFMSSVTIRKYMYFNDFHWNVTTSGCNAFNYHEWKLWQLLIRDVSICPSFTYGPEE